MIINYVYLFNNLQVLWLTSSLRTHKINTQTHTHTVQVILVLVLESKQTTTTLHFGHLKYIIDGTHRESSAMVS